MKRLFIALELPWDLKKRIIQLEQEIQNDEEIPAEYKWTVPEQIHLTLAFLGDSSINKYTLIKKQLNNIKAEQFSLTFNGLGFFSRGKIAHILFLKLQNEEKLDFLQKEVTKVLKRIGISADKKKFASHLTIGRSKTMAIGTAKKLIQKQENSNWPLLKAKFKIFYFILYSSVLISKGALHTKEALYRLGVS